MPEFKTKAKMLTNISNTVLCHHTRDAFDTKFLCNLFQFQCLRENTGISWAEI